jgi:hypothetical protein
MDITLDSLEEIGKTSFTAAFNAGDFYFPKVVWGVKDGEIKIGMYETDFDLFCVMCSEAANDGPLEFIAHTVDTYYFDAKADPETAKRIQEGETSATEQFENENPNASEALAIVIVDAEDNRDSRMLLYKRHGRTLRWGQVINRPPGVEIKGRYPEVMAAAIKASYDAKDENAGG